MIERNLILKSLCQEDFQLVSSQQISTGKEL